MSSACRSHDVVVVGAGPVGLALVLALRRCGVDAVAMDRRRGPSAYPKARLISVRSMELLRRWNLAEQVRASALHGEWAERIVAARSVAGDELLRVESGWGSTQRRDASPEWRLICTQDRLARILACAADSLDGGAVHWQTEALAVKDDVDQAVVQSRDPRGRLGRWRARFVVLADGSHGLGAGDELPGSGSWRGFVRQVSIWVDTDLRRWVADRPAFIFYLVGQRVTGQLLVVDGARQWIVSAAAGRAATLADYTPRRVAEILSAVLGVSVGDPAVAEARTRAIRLWTIGSRVAASLVCGRVVRAGDAAHVIPPTGGMGLNLGLADADALAWRLAAITRGWGSPALLGGYHTERQAAAIRTGRWARDCLNTVARLVGASARRDDVALAGCAAGLVSYVDHPGLDLGPLLPPETEDPSVLVDDGRPGSRAPHLAIGPDGQSTLDRYGDLPAFVASESNVRALRLAGSVSRRLGIPLRLVPVPRMRGPRSGGSGDGGAVWHERYGVTTEGAVLVRPDGYVSWRAGRLAPGDRQGEGLVTQALLQLTGRCGPG